VNYLGGRGDASYEDAHSGATKYVKVDRGRAALLLLADGRLPSGGHVHSGGIEAAVTDGRVYDHSSLGEYLDGRLATAGETDAALAACAASISAAATTATALRLLELLDVEAAARTPAAALRGASRMQGRGLLRAARAAWPGAPLLDELGALGRGAGALWPLCLGAAAAAAGIDPSDAAVVACQSAITGPAAAALRLLGLDPYRVLALLAARGGAVEAIAGRAAARGAEAASVACGGDASYPPVTSSAPPAGTTTATAFATLPAASGPLQDIGAEAHGRAGVRLFAS
jgi:urease accessory protein